MTACGFARLPRLFGRALVTTYRYTLSPLIGPRCRHLPSCAEYADEAIARFGLWAGGWMALARILRCHPFGTAGLDFVPAQRAGARALVSAVALRALARNQRSAAAMSKRGNKILVAVIALSALASILFGLRSYGSYLLLRSAYEVGRPQVSSLRAWMTLDHVAASYRVPLHELLPRLGLPPDTRRDESLKDIADRRGVSRFDFAREVQRALGQSTPPPASRQLKAPAA